MREGVGAGLTDGCGGVGGGDNTDELDNDAGSDDAGDIVVVRELLFVRHSGSPIPRSSRVGLVLEVVGDVYKNFPPNHLKCFLKLSARTVRPAGLDKWRKSSWKSVESRVQTCH